MPHLGILLSPAYLLEELDPFQMAPGDRAFGHVAPHRHVSAIRIPVA